MFNKICFFVTFSFLALFLSIEGVRFSSFNIQTLGETKIKRAAVVDVLVKTIARYDITFVMEIRDKKGDAMKILMDRLQEIKPTYRSVLSEREGRTNVKEQYAYIYDSGVVSLKEAFVWESEKFERPPYFAHFSAGDFEFSTLGCHVQPREVVLEMDAMYDLVYENAINNPKYQSENLILMGDYNGDCDTLSDHKYDALRMVLDNRFNWVFDKHYDTSVAKRNCGYDKFVMVSSGKCHCNSITYTDAKVFRYDQAFNLTWEETKKVSDHYNIEMTLKKMEKVACGSCASTYIQPNFQSSMQYREHHESNFYRTFVFIVAGCSVLACLVVFLLYKTKQQCSKIDYKTEAPNLKQREELNCEYTHLIKPQN